MQMDPDMMMKTHFLLVFGFILLKYVTEFLHAYFAHKITIVLKFGLLVGDIYYTVQ